MTMRILSGYAKVDQNFAHRGTATIDFNNFQVTGNATGHDLVQIGTRSFTSSPAFHVAPRSFATGQPPCTMSIKVTNVSAQRLTIEWGNSPDMDIYDISFMIIGE
ncbi:MAG TPA: hypothetical protein VLR90_20015 [Blastocatellia bacterium]|nr:hypothetical protein [Blastocatellia bacterium]